MQVMSHAALLKHVENEDVENLILIIDTKPSADDALACELIQQAANAHHALVLTFDDAFDEDARMNHERPITFMQARAAMLFLRQHPDAIVSCKGGVSRSQAIAGVANIAGIARTNVDPFSADFCPNDTVLARCARVAIDAHLAKNALYGEINEKLSKNKRLWQAQNMQ